MTAPRYGFWQWADDNAPVALIVAICVCMAASKGFEACGRPEPAQPCADRLVYGSAECAPGQTLEETGRVYNERPYYVCRCPGPRLEPREVQDGGAD